LFIGMKLLVSAFSWFNAGLSLFTTLSPHIVP
jgi:hypothetical protein